jgi:hypothetical protein
MPLVTAAITRLVQQASAQRTVLVKNVGANPVDVSKDPAIVFGAAENFNLAANGEERIELEPGDSLFGRCGAALQSQVDVI